MRVDGDRELLAELVRLFAEDSPRTLEEIKRCAALGDYAGLERAAHTLKGALANLSASAATKPALALELIGRQGAAAANADSVEAYVEELEREMERLQMALASVDGDSSE